MPRRPAYPPLSVFLNGRLVGELTKETSGAINFQYAPSWLAWESVMPVSLSLPLREDRYRGEPVVAVFDNLLPDNDDIRRRLAARTGAGGRDAYSLLVAIGRDCVGALQFLPKGDAPGPAGHVQGRPVNPKDIASILADLNSAPLGVTADPEFRISLAGAQEKTALLFWKRKWQIPLASTATTHILKPAIGRRGNLDLSLSVENEHFCMALTAAAGLPTARTEIAEFAGKSVLVVERFDRRWTSDQRLLRLPQEDCCQALSFVPTHKYEADGGPGILPILQLLKGSDDPERDQRMFLKAQIVFWLLGAIDGHGKNFSVQLSPGGRFRLAPLYDVMSAQPSLDAREIQRNRMKLAMAVGRNRHYTIHSVAPRHFIETAQAGGIPANVTVAVLRELLAQIPEALERTQNGMPTGFPSKLATSVARGVRQRLALIERTPEVG